MQFCEYIYIYVLRFLLPDTDDASECDAEFSARNYDDTVEIKEQ